MEPTDRELELIVWMESLAQAKGFGEEVMKTYRFHRQLGASITQACHFAMRDWELI